MSEMWNSVGNQYHAQNTRRLRGLSDTQTNKDWGLLDLAGKLCRRLGNSDNRKWKTSH
jgi:hypothetical protein